MRQPPKRHGSTSEAPQRERPTVIGPTCPRERARAGVGGGAVRKRRARTEKYPRPALKVVSDIRQTTAAPLPQASTMNWDDLFRAAAAYEVDRAAIRDELEAIREEDADPS